jgi:hypothetical protein
MVFLNGIEIIIRNNSEFAFSFTGKRSVAFRLVADDERRGG